MINPSELVQNIDFLSFRRCCVLCYFMLSSQATNNRMNSKITDRQTDRHRTKTDRHRNKKYIKSIYDFAIPKKNSFTILWLCLNINFHIQLERNANIWTLHFQPINHKIDQHVLKYKRVIIGHIRIMNFVH